MADCKDLSRGHGGSATATASMTSMASARMLSVLCAVFACFILFQAPSPAAATDAVFQGDVYLTGTANYANITSLKAGQTFGFEFLFTDQASNATIGNIFSACIQLNGPSSCQTTVQLASGTIQAGLLTFRWRNIHCLTYPYSKNTCWHNVRFMVDCCGNCSNCDINRSVSAATTGPGQKM